MAPCIRWNLLVLVMSVFIVEGRARSLQNPVSSTLPEENTAALGNLLAKVVGQELDGCYLVVITAGVHQTSNVFTPIVRSLAKGYLPGVLVDVSLTTPGRHSPLLHHLRKGDGRFSCRVYLLDLISSNSMANENSDLLRFLEDIHTYLWPRTKMVMVGPRAHPHAFLNHHAFRNTAHALYLAPQLDILQSRAPTTLQGVGEDHLREENCSEGGDRERVGRERKNSSMLCGDVEVYWRCLYCNQGKPDVFLLDLWKLHSPYHAHHVLFPDQFENFHGHKFRIVSMDWFPFLGFTRDSNASATTVTLTDSLDYRMLTAISRVLNFTYEVRTPWDDQWGVSQADGNWTGTVGTLQHHQADFSMLLSWLHSRMAAVDYSRVYVSEPLVIVTSKSGPLPQIFALVRPFPSVLWAAILILSMVVGLTMWALQRAWAWISGGQEMRVSSALMMSWGILLEDPPNVLPANVTSQVLVGWWWVFCMLITATYRSSLIAHLSVPDKSPTIDTLDQLLEEDGWTWGMEPTYGVGWQWFKESSVPTVQKVNQRIEVLDAEEHLALVLQGRHAFLTWKYYIRTIIASSYTNARGYTPTYTGRSEYINYGGYGWGFRKGAPFRERIDAVKQRLLQGGLINYWMNELILTSSREARKNNSMEDTAAQVSERVVLGLGQLQGAFYLLILGYVAAAFTLLAETITNKFFRNAGQFPNTSLLPPLRR